MAVFSHGTAIRNLLTRLLHRPETPEGYLPEGNNTAVSCLEAEGEEIRVKWYNDSSHLTAEILAAAVKPDQGRGQRERVRDFRSCSGSAPGIRRPGRSITWPAAARGG